MSQRGRPLLTMVTVLSVVVLAGVLVTSVAGTTVTETAIGPHTDAIVTDVDDDADETDWLLTPEEPTNEAYEQVGIDVAGATATAVQEQTGEFDRAAYDEEYQSLGSLPAQRELTQDSAALIEQRLERLDTHHEELLAAYGDDELSPTILVRELSRVHVAAQNQQPLAELVRDNAEATGLSIDDRTENLPDNIDGELTFLQRSVGEELTGVMDGETDPQLVYLHGSTDGVVFAMVEDETIIREATLRNEQDTEADNQFDDPDDDNGAIGNAFQRSQELYHWVSTIQRVQGYGTTATYVVESDHQYGELIAYLDGGTTNAFHELQEVDAGEFPTSANVSTVDNETGVSLTVEATEPGGPLTVSAVEEETGEPITGTVTVSSDSGTNLAETEVGTTNGGALLTIQPVGEFTVTVTSPDGEETQISVPPDES